MHCCWNACSTRKIVVELKAPNYPTFPSYFPDLAPSDYYVFPKLKQMCGGGMRLFPIEVFMAENIPIL